MHSRRCKLCRTAPGLRLLMLQVLLLVARRSFIPPSHTPSATAGRRRYHSPAPPRSAGLKLTTTSQTRPAPRCGVLRSCHFNCLFITGRSRLLEQTPATQRREANPGITVKSRLESVVKTRQTRVMPGNDDSGWKGPAPHPPQKLPSVCPIIKFFHH